MDYMIIIISFAIMAAVGAFFGVLIGVCNHYFKVENNDAAVDDVAAMLPGVNCGSCGYPGCLAFAEALVAKNTTVENCRPSKEAQRKKIAEYLASK